jgi:hypothetical protein
MTPVVGIAVIVSLIIALFIANRTAKAIRVRRQKKNRRRRPARTRRLQTSRSEMRAYEDPSTVVGDITTTHGGPEKKDRR